MQKPKSGHVGTALFLACAAMACGDGRPRAPTTSTPVDLLVGPYSLTVTTGSACTTLSEPLRIRTYSARIESRGPDNFVVTLSDAKFLADEQIGERAFRVHCSSWYGLGCNQFTASREADQLRFLLAGNWERFDDEFAGDGGMIVEVIPPDNDRLGISGTGLGRLDGTTIQASIDGRVWHCPAKDASFQNECSNCDNVSVAMTFVRR